MKKLLINPFEKFSVPNLLLLGVAVTSIGSYLGYLFYGRFDGVIDLHFTDTITLAEPLTDNAINIFSLSVLLFLFGRIINKKTRFVDILAAAMVARIPFYFLPFSNIDNFMSRFSNTLIRDLDLKNPASFHIETGNLITLLLFAIISIGMLVWFVILLFHGFKVATNCKTPNHTLLFAIGIIAAEIVSKLLIYLFNY